LPTGLLIGYCGMAVATGIAVAAGGTRRPAMALAILAVAALLLAARATAPAAAGLAVMAWLFYSGFIAGRHANLTWQGMDDVWRLAVLAGSAAIGVGLSWLVAHLGEGHRLGESSRVGESIRVGESRRLGESIRLASHHRAGLRHSRPTATATTAGRHS
jgi:hypothetical protein